MHREGVLHRDIKPANVRVDPGGRLKLLDLGIAKGVSAQTTLTSVGLGTVGYMAPEQHTDASKADERADVYALGMTLYEMLAGCLPWGKQELSEFAVMTAKASGDFPPPTDHYPDIPPAVVEVLLKTLSVRPEDRPASAEELVRQLDEAIGFVAPLEIGRAHV